MACVVSGFLAVSSPLRAQDVPAASGLKVDAGHPRIGLNASRPELAERLAELGIGWIRFENGKWPFVSPEPNRYAFGGQVPPWHLDLDETLRTYRATGFQVLSYMFQTPEWCTTAPPDAPANMRLSFPPRQLELYGEFCFQMAARYGSREHPPQVLLSDDKRSGLGLLKYYEMWNEPNLNPSPQARWGGWAAPLDTYYEMMRHGSEAIKRADPTAVVTSAGYAGMTVDVVEPLATYRYSDGKRPLDFVDVINVHYYSGLEPPETCQTDGNEKPTGKKTLPENLQELARWRDQHAPGKAIWITETGYDSAGPYGVSEADQAARLPRVTLLCLAFGADKVLIYRESGSTPSRHAGSGLLRNDFTPKPAWTTMKTLVAQTRDVAGGARRLPHPDPKVWLLEWKRGTQRLLTVWRVEGTSTLGTDLGPLQVVDSHGQVSQLDSTSELAVDTFPRYLHPR